MESTYLLVTYDDDPVARAVGERWGTPPATDDHVDGSPVRQLSDVALLLRRPGIHIHDERLDARLPSRLTRRRISLVFPSIHRSEQNVECLTVHPLGNPGPRAEVGGRPRTLVPTDPARMTATLRSLSESSGRTGLPATFEATHHGPELGLPAFFAEIGFGTRPAPPEEAVRVLADALAEIRVEPRDRVALAVGGGHYAPHFTELALRRRWSFGHILSRHALATLDAATAASAWAETPAAEGILYARADDARLPVLEGLGPRRADGDAERRTAGGAPTGASRRASGT